MPPLSDIDARIDLSDQEWRDWCALIAPDLPDRDFLMRQALALKVLLYAPSGAIAAAATTSLPERIGGDKNYDYRFAWVRDAGYVIESFLHLGIMAEAKAALTWLLNQLCAHGAKVCFSLDGGVEEGMEEIPVPAIADHARSCRATARRASISTASMATSSRRCRHSCAPAA